MDGAAFAVSSHGRLFRISSVLHTLVATLCALPLLSTSESAVPGLQHKECLPHGQLRAAGPFAASKYRGHELQVKCCYFTTPPAHTYCLVRPIKDVTQKLADARRLCDAFHMRVPGVTTSTVERLNAVATLLGEESRSFWVTEGRNGEQLFTWEKHEGGVATGRAANASAKCSLCHVAVVCEAPFYFSNGSRCSTLGMPEHGVEYCYYGDKANARESSDRCKKQGARLADLVPLVPMYSSYVNGTMRGDLVFWLDLKREDVGKLGAVVAFNANSIDWSTSCFTLRLAYRSVPWIFSTDCNETHSVLCENEKYSGDCFYKIAICNASDEESGDYPFCIAENSELSSEAAREFCKHISMSSLRGASLNRLVDTVELPGKGPLNVDLFWTAQSEPDPSTTCEATNISGTTVVKQELECSTELGYMCTKRKERNPVQAQAISDLYCERVNVTASNPPSMCVNHVEFDFNRSELTCIRIGMHLLPEGLQTEDYKAYLSEYERFTNPQVKAMYWLQPLAQCRCVALNRSAENLTVVDVDCEARLHSVCVFPAPIVPLPSTNRTGCPENAGRRSFVSTETCAKDTLSTACTPRETFEKWLLASGETNIDSAIEKLNEVLDAFQESADIRGMCFFLTDFLKSIDALLQRIAQYDRPLAKKRVADALVSLVRKVTLRTEIWSCLPEEERLERAARLVLTVEEFVARSNGG